jgi:hypothetical protein
VVILSAGGVENIEQAEQEQITAIIALACEAPADSDLPISHWTPPELAREAIKRGIADSISARQVDRFLSRSTSDPGRAARRA